MSNFSSDQVELLPDAETGLRAFEWLLVRWHFRAHPTEEELAAAGGGGDEREVCALNVAQRALHTVPADPHLQQRPTPMPKPDTHAHTHVRPDPTPTSTRHA